MSVNPPSSAAANNSGLARVAAPIAAAVILQIASGVLAVVIPLAMDSRGLSAFSAGLVAGCYSVGFMAGALYAPRIIRHLDHIRTYAAAAGIGGALTLALYMRIDAFAWAPLRLATGFFVAILLTTAESWINSATPRERRGGVIGVYQVVVKVAIAAGPFLIANHAPSGPDGFMLAAACFALSLAPVCGTPHAQPPPPSAEPFPVKRIWEVAPAAVIGAALAGFTNAGVLAILPIHAARVATEVQSSDPAFLAAAFVAATWLGSTLVQWPAGRLSDRIDRRFVIACLGLLEFLGAIPLAIWGEKLPPHFAIAGAFVWGAGALSYYGLCVAHATDRAPHDQAARVVSGLLFVYSAGSVVGPSVAGAAFDTPLGGRALFGIAAASGLLLVIAMWGRRISQAAAEVGLKVPFMASPPGPSVAMAEMVGDSASDAHGPKSKPPADPA